MNLSFPIELLDSWLKARDTRVTLEYRLDRFHIELFQGEYSVLHLEARNIDLLWGLLRSELEHGVPERSW